MSKPTGTEQWHWNAGFEAAKQAAIDACNIELFMLRGTHNSKSARTAVGRVKNEIFQIRAQKTAQAHRSGSAG